MSRNKFWLFVLEEPQFGTISELWVCSLKCGEQMLSSLNILSGIVLNGQLCERVAIKIVESVRFSEVLSQREGADAGSKWDLERHDEIKSATMYKKFCGG